MALELAMSRTADDPVVRLNLGSGETEIEGYTPIDRSHGAEVFPLDYQDGSVDMIRASHVLEHFSHRDIPGVVGDWVRALKPGGMLRIAVPDFEIISKLYLAGKQAPIESWIMGGHADDNDHHGALFDYSQLVDVLSDAGLIGISRWRSEIDDCAALPISLNLQAYKPPAVLPKTSCVLSVPRLGFMDNSLCLVMLRGLGIEPRKVTGAYWGQCLTRGIEQALREDDPEWILTVDYDSLFTSQDVLSLLMLAQKESALIDALAPLQMSRGRPNAMFTIRGPSGSNEVEIHRDRFAAQMVPVATAHFGLTLLKASKLREMPRPWFHAIPDKDGGWDDGRTDDDVHFWRQWEKSGNTLYIAPRVPIGHGEFMISWPNMDLETTYASPTEFWQTGKPEDIWR